MKPLQDTPIRKAIVSGMITGEQAEAIEYIKKYCQPYLKATEDIGLFYRGDSSRGETYIPEMLYSKEVRTDRTTSAMKQGIADKLNDYLEKNGHCRRDNSIIATSDPAMTGFHGRLYYIFPMEKFDYTFASAVDMNMEWLYVDYRGGVGSDIYNTIAKGHFKSIPKTFFKTNKNIATAFERRFEIWFRCKRVFLLVESSIDERELKQLLWG